MKKPYNVHEMKKYEYKFYSEGIEFVGGADEAGRGPLAGPVVAAAVIMPKDSAIEGVDDSKKLSEKKREKLYDKIISEAVSYKIVFIDEKTIDEINILEATKLGMKRAIEGLNVKPDVMLIDAISNLDVEIKTVGIIHGDSISYNIAAASILAKVARDRYMKEIDAKYPEYGFAKHKGYGTKSHMDAIRAFGASRVHRKSFLKFLEK